MENYIDNNRPPEHIKSELDINYRIDNQSIVLYETRPDWQDKTKVNTHDFAKTTFLKKENVWKVV